MEASKILEESQEFLKNLIYARFERAPTKNNLVMVKIVLCSKLKNKVPVHKPFFFPEITKKSPALAY